MGDVESSPVNFEEKAQEESGTTSSAEGTRNTLRAQGQGIPGAPCNSNNVGFKTNSSGADMAQNSQPDSKSDPKPQGYRPLKKVDNIDIQAEHLELASALRDLSASFAAMKKGQQRLLPGVKSDHSGALASETGSKVPEEMVEEDESVFDLEPMATLPPRTIPFRSASFSQVDISSEGNLYIRNPRSPITLKPTAFCYLTNPYSRVGAGPSTLPRTHHHSHHHHRHPSRDENHSSSNSTSANNAVSFTAITTDGTQPEVASTSTPNISSCNGCNGTSVGPSSLSAPDIVPKDSTEFPNKQDISRTTTDMANLDNLETVATSLGSKSDKKVLFEVGDPDYVDPAMDEMNHKSVNSSNQTEAVPNPESFADPQTFDNPQSGDTTAESASTPPIVDKNEEPSSSNSNTNSNPPSQNSLDLDLNSDNKPETDVLSPEALSQSEPQPPRIVREESLTLGTRSSSSEEGTEGQTPPSAIVRNTSTPLSTTEKAKIAFKLGLHAKLPLLDLDNCGGGSSISGEEDDKSYNLHRQSSGQSDGSEGQSDKSPCASPPVLRTNTSITSTSPITPLTTALVLDANSKSGTKTMSSSSFSKPSTFASSPPYSNYKYTSPGSPPVDFSRANSVSAGSTQLPSSKRYYKRPLRGPYGEMLEAEMNKVLSGRKSLNRELDTSLDFCRESKSSSPPPSDTLNLALVTGSPKLSNPYLMASMDDLNLNLSSNKNKHPNPRRKISTNIPVSTSHYHTGEEGGVLAYHQRTASSPSQLLYTSGDQTATQRRHLDASPRGHVLAELVETEKSYVDSLRILVKKYMEPLKSSDFIDTGLVDEIFFQIPAILWHHERILDALQRRVIDDTQSVGDVMLDAFRQNSLLECYSLFVNNWKNAKGSLKMAVASKPPLARFLEANARQHKGKLSIDSLLIMPIQRIPRYELLVKELLKYTEPTHEDHSRLMLVLEKIKKFAVHIDCASVDPNDNREIEIEGWTAGLGHLVRQDVVTLSTSSNVRKERALFLFADSVVIASIKRKSTMRKTSSNQYQPPGANLEGCKFKLLMKIPLTDIHMLNDDHDAKGSCHSTSSHSEDIDDLKTIHKMMDLANLLKCPHVGLDDTLRELAGGLRHHCDNNADAVEFEIKAAEGSGESPDILKILFGTAEKKNSWLGSFQDTLGKFIRYGFGKMPQMQFLQALPIRKTRAGLLLSCAASVSLHNKSTKNLEMSDVWVANSDGYVGQICILTLHPEPAITSCNGVCNSRITCILAVKPSGSLALAVPPATSLHDSQSASFHSNSNPHGYESEDDGHRNRSGHKQSTEHWSVWLGTEDGSLHVYDCSDSVRVKKNRHKVQHKAPLNCMVYYDNRVFVSLGNGDVAVYCRNLHGKGWLVNEPSWVTIGSGINPVTRMTCVANTIWCVSGSQIKVYGDSSGMLELLQTIHISGDHSHTVPRGVFTLAAAEETVWIALQSSSVIKSYSNISYECLFQIDVGTEVSKILTGCDDIIRQHKSACLRVTALLVAPDKALWIGTSAGVILTLTSSGPSRKLTPLCQGHTGQVRFLTCCISKDSCVVISGGDGYEEFRPLTPVLNNSGASSFTTVVSSSIADTSVDLSGREDSTNHLLIWRVPKPIPS